MAGGLTDVFDKAKRSDVMSRIRGRGNRSTEMKLLAAFKAAGVRGWRRHVRLTPRAVPDEAELQIKPYRLKVEPDFIFRPQKLAVFVDGCFWHGCPLHATKPKANAEIWERKLVGNIRRDKRATKALEAAGWSVLRIWEHELTDMEVVLDNIRRCLAVPRRPVPGATPHGRSNET
jgi:DNA mismatch endonuclease, patch repair protein